MKVIIDNYTLDKEECEKLIDFFKKNNCTVYLYNDEMSNSKISGNRFDTIYITKSSGNIYIKEKCNDMYITPTLLKIDDNTYWDKNESNVDAKAKSVDDIINLNILTLYAEKKVFMNNNFSNKNTSYIYYEEPIGNNNNKIEVYCQGRYFSSIKMTDSLYYLTNKIKTKFKSDENHLKNLSKFIKECYDDFIKKHNNYDIVCYVPVKKEKFNRFKEIVNDNIIKLKKEYSDLTTLNVDERKEEVKDCFYISNNESVKDKTILVIDDVITTGSTVKEIACLLYSQGAKKIDILTLAQTSNKLEQSRLSYLCPKCKKNFLKVRFNKKNGYSFIACENWENCKYITNNNIILSYNFIYALEIH